MSGANLVVERRAAAQYNRSSALLICRVDPTAEGAHWTGILKHLHADSRHRSGTGCVRRRQPAALVVSPAWCHRHPRIHIQELEVLIDRDRENVPDPNRLPPLPLSCFVAPPPGGVYFTALSARIRNARPVGAGSQKTTSDRSSEHTRIWCRHRYYARCSDRIRKALVIDAGRGALFVAYRAMVRNRRLLRLSRTQ